MPMLTAANYKLYNFICEFVGNEVVIYKNKLTKETNTNIFRCYCIINTNKGLQLCQRKNLSKHMSGRTILLQ